MCIQVLSFIHVGGTCARSTRLDQAYSKPMSEIYLMFFQAALQLFVNYNKFLQREDPIIPILVEQLMNFLKKLFGRFVKVGVIKSAEANLTSLDYKQDNQLPDENNIMYKNVLYCSIKLIDASLFIGFSTRQLLNKHREDGEISDREVKVFYGAVRAFYSQAASYALKNLPFNDEVLVNAKFVDFGSRMSSSISQVAYFVTR